MDTKTLIIIIVAVVVVIAGVIVLLTVLSKKKNSGGTTSAVKKEKDTVVKKEIKKSAGKVDEKLIRKELGKTVDTKQYVYNNYPFLSGTKSVKVENIVVNENGVFVIEAMQIESLEEGEEVIKSGYDKHIETCIGTLKEFLPKTASLKHVSVKLSGTTEIKDNDTVVALENLKGFLSADSGTRMNAVQIKRTSFILDLHKDNSAK